VEGQESRVGPGPGLTVGSLPTTNVLEGLGAGFPSPLCDCVDCERANPI
jgi:hypothetical protein